MSESKEKVSDAAVIEALGISTSKPTGDETDNNDRKESKKILKLATSKQKNRARKSLGTSYKHGGSHKTESSVELRMGPALTAEQLEQEKKVSSELDDEMAKFKARAKARAAKAKNKNMGGMMTDELGYMRGGMTEEARGPIKYSKGGAIAGKNFKGSF